MTRVAVVGAGMAGAICARRLADAGFDVRVFDKSRGVGGRLATRRAAWTAPDGTAHVTRFDHGAPAFGARSPAFARFVERAARDGRLARWSPRLSASGYAPLDETALWVPTPDMPTLCRDLLAGLPLRTQCLVEALHRGASGWRLQAAGDAVTEVFDAVVVATPAPQAAPLLRAHRADWAERADVPMRAGWTLMAVTDAPAASADWDLAWPAPGSVLAQVVRNDAKPERERDAGWAHWVVHATAAWSATHLKSPAADVQAALQSALEAALGQRLAWHHAAVHRWRHASVPRTDTAGTPCWWDAAAGLGACGDALGGGGVEGAWTSGAALADLIVNTGRGSQAHGRLPSSPLAPR